MYSPYEKMQHMTSYDFLFFLICLNMWIYTIHIHHFDININKHAAKRINMINSI